MEIRDGDDLIKKYEYMITRAATVYFIGLLNIAFYIWTLIGGYSAVGFIMNSAVVLFLSNSIFDMYDYFIAHTKFTNNPRYNGGVHKYLSVFLLGVNAVFYLVSLIGFRMSFDQSINGTEEEVLLTIAFCMWTFIIGHGLGKVNSKMEEYIKIIKS